MAAVAQKPEPQILWTETEAFEAFAEILAEVVPYPEITLEACKKHMNTPLRAEPFEFGSIDFPDLNFRVAQRFKVPELKGEEAAELEKRFGQAITLGQAFCVLLERLQTFGKLKT